MHAIEEAKGCMQKGKDFNRLQVFLEKAIFWGDTIFRGEVIFGEKPFLGRSHFLETYPCKECRETFFKACRFRDQQKTLSGEKPYPCTVYQRHIPVKYVMRHFLKHVGLRINKRLIQERSHIVFLVHGYSVFI